MIELFDKDELVFRDNDITTDAEVLLKDGKAYVRYQTAKQPGLTVTRHRLHTTLDLKGWTQ